MAAAATLDSEWLQEQIQALMNPPPDPFEDLFTQDATGTVAGTAVDRAGLRQALLVVQGKWNNDTVSFTPLQFPDGSGRSCAARDRTDADAAVMDDMLVRRYAWMKVGIRADWMTPTGTNHWMSAIATTVQEDGTDHISTLVSDGDQGLFIVE